MAAASVFLIALSAQMWAQTDVRLVAMGAFLSTIVSWIAILTATSRQAVKPVWIGTVLALAFVVVVGAPPSTSKDFNSYALYGRMVSEYGASPYSHTPVDFAADPWFERTSVFWSDSPSVYGPAFTAISAAVTSFTGTSVTATRLAFQLLAALGLLACVLLAARRLGASKSMALVGLNPLLLTMGVNDAHCDLLIGLCVLAAVLALERRRFLISGVLIGLGVAVKFACLPALGGAIVWAFFAGSKSDPARNSSVFAMAKRGAAVLAGALATNGLLLALLGGLDVFSALASAAGRHTRFSIWNPLHDLITNNSASALPTHSVADTTISIAANLAVLVIGLIAIFKCRNDPRPIVAVACGLVVYQLFGAYVLAWYAAWSLPALSLQASSRTYVISLAHACWVAIAYFSGFGGIAVLILAGFLLWRFRPSNVWTFWRSAVDLSQNSSNRDSVAVS